MGKYDVYLNASLDDVRKQLYPGEGKKPRWLRLYNFNDRKEQLKKVALVLEAEDQFEDPEYFEYGLTMIVLDNSPYLVYVLMSFLKTAL